MVSKSWSRPFTTVDVMGSNVRQAESKPPIGKLYSPLAAVIIEVTPDTKLTTYIAPKARSPRSVLEFRCVQTASPIPSTERTSKGRRVIE